MTHTGTATFSITSHLRASADEVWAHASTFVGVNRELSPLVRMTYPKEMATIAPENFPLGRKAFRSWILLFGVLPVEFDDITLVELEPGRTFLENSQLFSMRVWNHRRTITPLSVGCELCDELTYAPRWRWTGPLLGFVYRRMFNWRHRVLRRTFGAM